MLEVTICDLQRKSRGFTWGAEDVMKEKTAIIPFERIATVIHLIRGQKVMLDRDLALLYGVETRVLNQAVRRNYNRFPPDFMLTLAREEIRNISQIVICSEFPGA